MKEVERLQNVALHYNIASGIVLSVSDRPAVLIQQLV